MYWPQEGDEWVSSHRIDEVFFPLDDCGLPKIGEMGEGLIGKRWYKRGVVAEVGE